jgi:hypothetical protein
VTVLVLVLSALLAADAAKRPDTYTLDPRLTAGPIENFRELFVDPTTVIPQLAPVADAEPGAVGDLAVKNDFTAMTEVSISGTKIGVLGALTDGVIRGVPKGTYDVVMRYANGFEHREQVSTSGVVPAPKTAPVASATVVAPPTEPPKSGETDEAPTVPKP